MALCLEEQKFYVIFLGVNTILLLMVSNENTRRLAIWVKLIRTKMGVWIRILSLISQPM